MVEDDLAELLKRLPLRAQIAVATRSARRAQSVLLDLPGNSGKEPIRDAVESAIRAAERFAGGARDVDPDASCHALDAAASIGASLSRVDRDAACAAVAAVNAADWAADNFAPASHNCAAQAVAFASEALRGAPVDFDGLVLSDVKQLDLLHLGAFPELGNPIDPSVSGPLGSLWPDETS
jgi:hypothetical protein